MNNPKVSVVMTAYNSAKYIGRSILSILNQTIKDFELIIVNDCSSDNTLEIIKSYAGQDSRIRFMNNEVNLKPAVSRNKALAQARGKYIAILDSDDISMPNRLQLQAQYLNSHPEISLVGCAAEIINDKEEVTGVKRPTANFSRLKFELLTKNQIIHSGVFYKKTEIDELNGYDNNYLHSEDYKLYSSLMKKHKLSNLPDILIQYRHSPGAISINADTRKTQLEHAFEISFENLSNYIQISREQAQLLFNSLNNIGLSAKGVLISWKIYKNLVDSFAVKERLDSAQSKEIRNVYKSDVKLMIRRCLKSIFKIK